MPRAFALALLFLIASPFFVGPAMAGETLAYQGGDVMLEGYLARTAVKNAPLVLIVHQWKGLGAYEKSRADMLAAAGYNAFAIDMYGKDVRPATAAEAGAQAGRYKGDPALARQRLNAALNVARTFDGIDTSRIAIMGYCFGGTMALELARSGADIDAAISFHGGLGSKAPVTAPGIVKASLLIHHGAADPNVPPAEVQGFIAEMNSAKADWVLTQYAGAVHSFTDKSAGNDPATGAAYNEKADHRSWAATLDFLAETLKTAPATP